MPLTPGEFDALLLAALATDYPSADWAAAWPDENRVFDFDVIPTRAMARVLYGNRTGVRYYFRDTEKGWMAASE